MASLVGLALAAAAIKEKELANFFGRTIAIDASMTIYQFMVRTPPGPTTMLTAAQIAVRSGGEVLTNEAGEVTR